ncbi:excalibur calcium-binding domain-containing protein [Bacillus sp. AFS017274]|uniref:excalibur calcium-binding domain-containing protein n=1 Tax=Bacillus sp. AFS017274 TaxID=2033488 RepID=UPI000BF609CF|nr:excalibur calcium-binding domain-containing protein [Bacillus sp. AFS017274]PEZ72689.1 hypothetical protein CN380_25040 [Bacillus sp. AFS017274]
MKFIKWIMIAIALFVILSTIIVTPFAWIGLIIFLFGIYQMIQRSKGRVTFSKPGWVVVAGFLLSCILAMIFVEPVNETVPKEKKEITIKQEQKEAEHLAREQKKKEEAARLAEEKKEQEAVNSVYYENCDAVRSAGAAPVYEGSPGYGKHLDRDGDGIGCDK